jgi:hypothetical protein
VLNISNMTGYLAGSSKRVSHLISTHPIIMISIINQIHTSIASEAIDRLDRHDEMQCEESKMKYIQGKTQAPPQTKP